MVGEPMPEAFQLPNGKSTAALAVEPLILRIPARARRRKSAIRFGEVLKMAAAITGSKLPSQRKSFCRSTPSRTGFIFTHCGALNFSRHQFCELPRTCHLTAGFV